jgi:FMN hydrolase / 5-amino-6-(5-phospho-D-ribitylamino)uracil phosphatase
LSPITRVSSDIDKVRVVAFDLDNTLWDIGPVIERAEKRMHEWLNEHCPRIPAAVSAEQMRAAREALAVEEPHNAHDFTYLRVTALARHARECGYDDSVAHSAFEVFFAARNQLDLFPDVLPALERLGSRYALATLSNGNADLQRVGVAHLFSLSLNARQIGVGKPHPRVFERLAKDLNVEPHEIVYVGDDPVHDVEGPRASGLSTAWVNRFNWSWPANIASADYVVTNCLELADQLGV